MYLCKFDLEGKRISTVVSGIHFETDEEKQRYIDDGYIETSNEDYAYYVGNMGNGVNGTGYVRGKNGKPTDAPTYTPPEPTKEEKLAQLVAQYEADKAEILKYYADAMIHGDTELMAELAKEMTALDEQYATDYEALKEGE